MIMNNDNDYIIYIHKSPSGKVYIGQTKNKVNYRGGHDGHNYLAKHNDGTGMHPGFAPAILKYGGKSMSHEVLFTGLSHLEANMIEMDLIFYYKKLNKCYNVTDGGDGGSGTGCHKIRQYDKSTGKLIKEGDKINEAEKALCINNISACCNRRRNIAGDGIGRYADENLENVNPKEALCKHSRAVIQYSLDGKEIARFDRMQDAVIATGVDKRSIQECCIGRQKSGKGYKGKYVDESFVRKVNTNLKASGAKKIGIYDKNYQLINIYYSVNEASRQTGIPAGTLQQCCRRGCFSKKHNCYCKYL